MMYFICCQLHVSAVKILLKFLLLVVAVVVVVVVVVAAVLPLLIDCWSSLMLLFPFVCPSLLHYVGFALLLFLLYPYHHWCVYFNVKIKSR